MMKVFKYKHKVFPKILILLIFIFLPLIINNGNLYFSFIYYLIFILIQLIIHLYYLSKRLIVTDNGIAKMISWVIMVSRANWTNMEEAQEIVSSKTSTGGSLQSMMEPFSGIKWFVRKNTGHLIKIIVTNDMPLYINLKEIKNSSDLYDILKEKIRFV